ncbi:DUF547 domain-containing protein (plasmid) [Halorientalis pallida]|uniref:DUF547 domain-containing protein n=1 Tax=Halorientalis pallida TaxID=2479928 RepID=UPI003C6F6A7C
MSSQSTLLTLSQEFLTAVKRREDSTDYRNRLATTPERDLATLTGNEDTAKAFWINLYNAFVQSELDRDPSLYDSKRSFFGDERFEVAGTRLSLDDIEHGILRSSKWKYGLGYIPRLFPSEFERAYRLPTVDPRIHFALNCGAESCPAIAAYSGSGIDRELDLSTRSFLQQSSKTDPSADEIIVSRLFLYYRGDFGGRRGIYEFLERFDVIDAEARPRVRYDSYDWALHRGNYRDERNG